MKALWLHIDWHGETEDAGPSYLTVSRRTAGSRLVQGARSHIPGRNMVPGLGGARERLSQTPAVSDMEARWSGEHCISVRSVS